MPHPQRDLDIYPARLHLITSGKQWKRHHRDLPMHQPDAPDSAGLTATTLDTHAAVLHVTVWVDTAWHDRHGHSTDDTAIHEAVHAGGAILDHFGQSYDGQSEALAYLVDWIARWLRSNLPKAKPT